MPILANARHETFSQLAAQGIDGTHAYMTVYPKSSEDAARSSAATLLANPSVRARVQELQSKTAERAVVTAQMILERAVEIAMSDDKDRVPALSVASRFFPEFRESYKPDEGGQHLHFHFENLSVEELREIARG